MVLQSWRRRWLWVLSNPVLLLSNPKTRVISSSSEPRGISNIADNMCYCYRGLLVGSPRLSELL